VVASDGVPVVVDAGRPTYTLQTFGPDRYDIWTMQSGWHNVPLIGGVEQSPGAEFAAAEAVASVADDASSLSLELSRAYAGTSVSSWARAVRLDRPARQVVIEDSWSPSVVEQAQPPVVERAKPPVVERAKRDETPPAPAGPPVPVVERAERDETPPAPAPTQVRMLLAGDVRRVAASTLLITPLDDATPVRISWPAAVPAALTTRELDDPMLSSVWGARLTRLDLDVTACQSIAVTIELDLTNAEDAR
jgi:hypothetical protein